MDTLARYANLAAVVVSTVNGAQAPKVERTTGMPQVSIQYDRSRIAQYGLKH
jgi:cobalt-zinc-cadmium resistance protein CzcA